uniref:Uncharacterized protein n=1 Tax=Myotis myotis TaxID=51298 RepID=A0A7J7QTG0_MYOMY|nr:hypothetical protein mMyoMyo1_011827 [Myotis myotis]
MSTATRVCQAGDSCDWEAGRVGWGGGDRTAFHGNALPSVAPSHCQCHHKIIIKAMCNDDSDGNKTIRAAPVRRHVPGLGTQTLPAFQQRRGGHDRAHFTGGQVEAWGRDEKWGGTRREPSSRGVSQGASRTMRWSLRRGTISGLGSHTQVGWSPRHAALGFLGRREDAGGCVVRRF